MPRQGLPPPHLNVKQDASEHINNSESLNVFLREHLRAIERYQNSVLALCITWTPEGYSCVDTKGSIAAKLNAPPNGSDPLALYLKEQTQILELGDFKSNPRFKDSRLVHCLPQSGSVIFAPIKSTNATNWGGLLIVGNQTSTISAEDKDIVAHLSNQISRHLELEQLKEKCQNLSSYLEKSSNWKALAELASGVAHEINNPLAILQARLTRIQTLLTQESFNKDDMNKQILSSLNVVDRMNRIVRGLKALARDGESLEFIQSDLSEIFLDTMGVCEQKLKAHNITLIKKIDKQIIAYCNPVQITQVLVNLINNAVDVLKNFEGSREISFSASESNKFVTIELSNSGPLIPEEVRANLFSPFFSTKKAGEGLGLGLSIATNIVKAHGGSLEALANRDQTTFRISFPLEGKS